MMAEHNTQKTQMVTTPSQQDKEGKKGKGYNNLPTDVVSRILSRVPPVSVYNLRSVDKQWHNLICNDPYFTEDQLLHANQDMGWIIEMANPLKGKGFFDTYWMKLEDGEVIKQNINISHQAIVTVLASCNGLLLMKKRSTLYVANPITKQQMKLPPHGFRQGYDRYALAYIPLSKKYKVLYYSPREAKGCMILTLGSNTWNHIDQPRGLTHKYSFLIDNCHLSINGIVFWKLVFRHWNGPSFLLSTDANTEKSHIINLPEEICISYTPNDYPFFNQIVEMNGHLAFMSATGRFPKEMGIWMLEDFHNGIWRKHQLVDLSHLREKNLVQSVNRSTVLLRPVMTLQEGKVIIFVEFRESCLRFLALDIESTEVTFVDVMGHVRKDRWMPHIMTLVPPPVPELKKKKKA